MDKRKIRARRILGEWLARNRKKFGYTQADIAEETGLKQPRLSKLENATGDMLPLEIAVFLQLYADGEPFPWAELQQVYWDERRRLLVARVEFTESLMGLYLAGLINHDGTAELVHSEQAS